MATLQEIYEKFQQLDQEARQRLLAQLQQVTPPPFDWDGWIARVNALQSEIRATHGEDHQIDAIELLREVREEED